MNQLKLTKEYSLTEEEIKKLTAEFVAGYCDENECLETIADFFDETGYVFDTHTSVAGFVASGYIEDYNSNVPMVILSTASPYKFPQNVLLSLTNKNVKDAFIASEKLRDLTAYPIPNQILELKEKEVRFSKCVDKNGTKDAVIEFISKI
jgi:threonine synthase